MKTLIVYCSSHGTTAKAVSILGSNLDGDIYMINLKEESLKLDLGNFDKVIIGGSIHMGNIQRKIRRFISEFHDELLTRELGLFLCCMKEGEDALMQFNRAFPLEMRKNSVALGLFGGEYLFGKMNFIEKKIVKKVSGSSEDQSTMDIAMIMEFASRMNAAGKTLV